MTWALPEGTLPDRAERLVAGVLLGGCLGVLGREFGVFLDERCGCNAG